jgi:phosphatidylglycerol:prolipoprotein diacylglycerol transferase
MFPIINIFGKQIPMYAVMAVIGGGVMCLVCTFLAKKRKLKDADDMLYMLLYAGIGCVIGAKLLYLIVSVDVYYLPEKGLTENLKYWYLILTSGGLVFYGGLAGAFLGALRYCRHFSVPFEPMIEAAVTGMPLFHAFGRIGCFLAGCCYGMPYDGAFSVTFENALAAPNGVALLPVQLIESGLNFLLFGVLAAFFLKNKPRLSITGLYFVCYSVIRFILEFFRGDAIRGKAILSTSQWISIAVFIAGWALIFRKIKLQKEVCEVCDTDTLTI